MTHHCLPGKRQKVDSIWATEMCQASIDSKASSLANWENRHMSLPLRIWGGTGLGVVTVWGLRLGEVQSFLRDQPFFMGGGGITPPLDMTNFLRDQPFFMRIWGGIKPPLDMTNFLRVQLFRGCNRHKRTRVLFRIT